MVWQATKAMIGGSFIGWRAFNLPHSDRRYRKLGGVMPVDGVL
jgi:hypothetical protein